MAKCHHLLLMAISIILVFKTNLAFIYLQNPVSSDGYLVRVKRVKWEKGLYRKAAIKWLKQKYKEQPRLFPHWQLVHP